MLVTLFLLCIFQLKKKDLFVVSSYLLVVLNSLLWLNCAHISVKHARKCLSEGVSKTTDDDDRKVELLAIALKVQKELLKVHRLLC